MTKPRSTTIGSSGVALCIVLLLVPLFARADAIIRSQAMLAGTIAEFYLEKDHTVTITFYDAALKPVSVAAQTMTVIAVAKGGKKTLEFEKKGDVLVSKTKLPEGDGYNVVVLFKQTADAKSQNFRFKLDTHTCAECKRAEYACICDH